MAGSPMQKSYQHGTPEELKAIRLCLDRQIEERKANAKRTYLEYAAIALFVSAIAAGVATASLPLTCLLLAAGQLICPVCWLLTYGPVHRKAKFMELVMITLVEDEISFKTNQTATTPSPHQHHYPERSNHQ